MIARQWVGPQTKWRLAPQSISDTIDSRYLDLTYLE